MFTTGCRRAECDQLIPMEQGCNSKTSMGSSNEKRLLVDKMAPYFYIKQQELEQIPLPKSVSWVIRKILNTGKLVIETQQLQGHMLDRLMQLQKGEKFGIKMLYLLQIPQYPKVAWKKMILQPHMQPSHKFNLWLAL